MPQMSLIPWPSEDQTKPTSLKNNTKTPQKPKKPHEIQNNFFQKKNFQVFWNRLHMGKLCQLLLHVLARYIRLLREVLAQGGGVVMNERHMAESFRKYPPVHQWESGS